MYSINTHITPSLKAESIVVAIILTFLSMATSATNDDFFPFGVYEKSDPYGRFDPSPFEPGSEEWKQYRRDITGVFKRYNINTVLNTGYQKFSHAKYAFDLFHENGIKVIYRPSKEFRRFLKTNPDDVKGSIFDHPAFIAFLQGNEPNDMDRVKDLHYKISLIRRHFDQPVLTAMIGESMNIKNRHPASRKPVKENMSVVAWELFDPQVLFARNYAIRRTFDFIDWPTNKMYQPLQDWAAYMETAYKNRPWWYIPQLIGKGFEKHHDSYWRFPTSDELNVVVHIALANGARGIIGWSVPSYNILNKKTLKLKKRRRTSVLDKNLRPVVARDGTIPLDQFAKIGELVDKHSRLLNHHKRWNIDIGNSNDEVLVVPRQDPSSGMRYLYVVNLDAEEANSTNIDVPAAVERATDIYSRNHVRTTSEGSERSTVYPELSPGQAMFIEI